MITSSKYRYSWRNTISFIIIILFLNSCFFNNKYPGYDKAKHGIYYQLLTFGDSKRKPVPGDYITVDLQYKTMEDSVFFKGKRKFQISEPQFKGSVDECFLMLSQEESANFIVSTDKFFHKTLQNAIPNFLDKSETMKIYIKMIEIQTVAEYEKEKEAFLTWIEDFGEYEKVILRQYLDQKQIEIDPLKDGLYFLRIRQGNGKKIRKGDTITVHYEGKFLNGKFFDSTKKRKEPFQFVYGQQWQVINGLEKAFGKMEEGEKAIIILPSQLGWGKKGSSTGIIPPYTSLIFELEVLEVKNAVK
ncbi:MAG: FKBP-type peptidyl-prolyl cis-trans isomerase [bacterium]